MFSRLLLADASVQDKVFSGLFIDADSGGRG